MCGLFGWQWEFGKQPNKQARALIAQELADGADDRGGQAWGVWSPTLVIRGLGPAVNHVGRFSALPSMFGHSRYATHGANKVENAHPFLRGGIALAHNGVLNNHYEMNRKYNRNHVVDSEHLLSQMLERKPFDEIEGYGAITWAADSDPGCIYMGRLTERGQLYVAQTDHGIIWSSVEGPAKDACRKARLKIVSEFTIEPGKCYFAEGGKFFVDNDAPSIKVKTPTYHQRWEDGMSGTSHNAPFTVGWCNLHKTRYSNGKVCTCRTQEHVVQVLFSACPKDGETAVAYTAGNAVQLKYCSWGSCMNHRPPDGSSTMCMEHKIIHSARPTPPTQPTTSPATTPLPASTFQPSEPAVPARGPLPENHKSAPDYGPYWCTVKGCITPRDKADRFCQFHLLPSEGGNPSPIQLTEVVDVRTGEVRTAPDIAPVTVKPPESQLSMSFGQQQSWYEDMRRAWTLAEQDGEPTAEIKEIMKADLAEWWFESQHGMSGAAFVGMNSAEILRAAEDMGFDAEAALEEVLKQPKQEQDNGTPSTEASAGVQSPKAEHKPEDWGTIAPVVGSQH